MQVLQGGRVDGAGGVDRMLDRTTARFFHEVTSINDDDLIRWAEQSLDRLAEPRLQDAACNGPWRGSSSGQPALELAIGDRDPALAGAGGLLREAANDVALRQARGPHLLLQPRPRAGADGHERHGTEPALLRGALCHA